MCPSSMYPVLLYCHPAPGAKIGASVNAEILRAPRVLDLALDERVEEARMLEVVAEPTGVRQQLTQRDVRAVRHAPRQPALDRVPEAGGGGGGGAASPAPRVSRRRPGGRWTEVPPSLTVRQAAPRSGPAGRCACASA